MPVKVKTSPKDVFLHLLGIGMLYTSAVSFIALLFQYVNYFLPDPLAYDSVNNGVRLSLSALIIVYPVYVWITKMLERDIAQSPEKRTMGIRRWLIHFTLFISAITIIVDLIALIYNFLGGELSPRFFLKILAVLFVAAVIFAYYIWDLKRSTPEIPEKMKMLAMTVSVIVGAGVIGGFFLAGSPASQRMRQFDDQRTGSLQSIQYQLVDYWQRKGSLPASLDDLKNDISGFTVPRDPETDEPYTYRKTGDLTFDLCAVFTTDTAEINSRYPKAMPITPYGERNENWTHGKGETCFNRTIDPDFYKPLNGMEKVPPPLQ